MKDFKDMAKRWCRLGVSLYLTEDELKRLEDETADVITEVLIAGRAIVDGETYFPITDDMPEELETDMKSTRIITASYTLWNGWDNVLASMDIFRDLESAVKCRDNLRKMWEEQGFYTDNQQNRIDIDTVMEHIKIKMVNDSDW